MNTEKFETAVKNRANERVQEKIRKFRSTIDDAIRQLFPSAYCSPSQTDDGKLLLAAVIVPQGNKWPSRLWRNEEDAVRKELFDLMDEAQRALRSNGPQDTDEKPEEAA